MGYRGIPSELYGASWANVPGTSVNWPSNGIGGVTTTAADSHVANWAEVVIERIMLNPTGAASGTLTIFAHDGTTALLAIPMTAGSATFQDIPLGDEGVFIRGGFSFSTSSAALPVVVFYRRIRQGG